MGWQSRAAESRSHPNPSCGESCGASGGGPPMKIPRVGPNGPDSGKRRPVGEGKRVGRAAEWKPRRRAPHGGGGNEGLRRQLDPVGGRQGGAGRDRALAQAVAGRGCVGRSSVGAVVFREMPTVAGSVLAAVVAVCVGGAVMSVRGVAVDARRLGAVAARARVVGATRAGNPGEGGRRERQDDEQADELCPPPPRPPHSHVAQTVDSGSQSAIGRPTFVAEG